MAKAATKEELVKAAGKSFAEGFMLLLEAAGIDTNAELVKETKGQAKHTATREGRSSDDDDDDEDDAPAKKATTKAKGRATASDDDDDDDDQEDHTPSKKGKAAASEDVDPKLLKKIAGTNLEDATRPELKELAEAAGIDVQGKKASGLREALAELVKSSGGGSSKASGKSSTKKAADDDDDDDDDEDEVEYPELKVMKKEFRIFCRVNRDQIEEENDEFFDSESDAKDPRERLHQILADEDILKEFWKDNVHELKEKDEWDDVVAEYEKMKAKE